MKETVAIYKKQRILIENSLTSMVAAIDAEQYDMMKEKSIFSVFPALKATYKINANHKQSTPMYLEEGADNSTLGMDKAYLLGRVQFREDNIYISNAYVNSRSGTLYITTVVRLKSEYLVYDFELYELLKELSLIEGHERFSQYTRYFYALFGFLLILGRPGRLCGLYRMGPDRRTGQRDTRRTFSFHHRADAGAGDLRSLQDDSGA